VNIGSTNDGNIGEDSTIPSQSCPTPSPTPTPTVPPSYTATFSVTATFTPAATETLSPSPTARPPPGYVVFTGHVPTDFPLHKPGVLVAPGTGQNVWSSNGEPTGWTIFDTRSSYDSVTDTAFFGMFFCYVFRCFRSLIHLR
jgi:hypothetical protein